MRQPAHPRIIRHCGTAASYCGGRSAARQWQQSDRVPQGRPASAARPDTHTSPIERRLVVLGKALFWDTQVGSDGQTACASCHFHAGADHRVTNRSPGSVTSTAAVRANTTLTAADFPFHAFANANDNTSTVTRDRREVVGSAGVVLQRFVGIRRREPDGCRRRHRFDRTVHDRRPKVRQVTSRNAPSVINAVLNLRNFWEVVPATSSTRTPRQGQQLFQRRHAVWSADARTSVVILTPSGLAPEVVRLDRSSLASQAVGPPLNGTEMSVRRPAVGGSGRKMLSLTPLARQEMADRRQRARTLRNAGGVGLRREVELRGIDQHNVSARDIGSGGADQMAANFGLFSASRCRLTKRRSLISDDTPVDRFLAGDGSGPQ